MFGWSRAERKLKRVSQSLYAAAVRSARADVFYQEAGVPDTPGGRFEILALHIFLLMRRMAREKASGQGMDGQALAQALFDTAFKHMEIALREMGIGDLGVPRRMKWLMQKFNKRSQVYEESLSFADNSVLAQMLETHVFGGAVPEGAAAGLAEYMRRCDAALAEQDFRELAHGTVVFPLFGGGGGMTEQEILYG